MMEDEPSTSRSNDRSPIYIRVIPPRLTGPSILRRKRLREERDTDKQDIVVIDEDELVKRQKIIQAQLRQHQISQRHIPSRKEVEYMQNLSKRYKSGVMKSMMGSRYCSEDSMSDEQIMKRLHARIECHLDILSCGFPMCGRTFDTLQLLAFHISYSHHDAASLSPEAALCYVCGHKMASAKGKNAHLLSKHRTLSREHNQQCVEQRDIVIAPDAPAAIRLVDNQIFRRKIEQEIEELEDVMRREREM